ncbi:hypothetical protein BCR33DRAFT_741649 [Rhizoclosmatium globosum]|uniref:Uncharacterized protein n=1 Tax=Rhizoclosmatium globosum TaxID=329046 RepID=A0A1Y2BTN6_9FUNG|nr:hypothetical protein BCR33DRAFT_741649 [Rhizoclosmatium globosum]|eukprot:ORY38109.1 hypothetical protein BCR33DRAFT_741649 [Rhizoclosmatium globosum]
MATDYNRENRVTIEPLKGPQNVTTWGYDFNRLLAHYKLDHLIDTSYVQAAHGPIPAANVANTMLLDPGMLHHAHVTPNDIYKMIPGVDNPTATFPGTIRENKGGLLFLKNNISPHLRVNIDPVSTCLYTQLTMILNRCNNMTDADAKRIAKEVINFKMMATDSVSDLFDRFRQITTPVNANPQNAHFQHLLGFPRQRTIISDSLVAPFHHQRGKIGTDAVVHNLDQLQTLIETIADEIEYVPQQAIANLTVKDTEEPTRDRRPQRGAGNDRLSNSRYNSLQTPRNPVPATFQCKTCNMVGNHYTWQCRKDARYADFVSKNKTKSQGNRDGRDKGKTPFCAPSTQEVIDVLVNAAKDKKMSAKLKAVFANLTVTEDPTEEDNNEGGPYGLGTGTAAIPIADGYFIILTDANYCPQATACLISTNDIENSGFHFVSLAREPGYIFQTISPDPKADHPVILRTKLLFGRHFLPYLGYTEVATSSAALLSAKLEDKQVKDLTPEQLARYAERQNYS